MVVVVVVVAGGGVIVDVNVTVVFRWKVMGIVNLYPSISERLTWFHNAWCRENLFYKSFVQLRYMRRK